MATTGTIVVETRRWDHHENENRLIRSVRCPCQRTAKRFRLLEDRDPSRQFDLSGKCVVGKGLDYRYNVLPETFESD